MSKNFDILIYLVLYAHISAIVLFLKLFLLLRSEYKIKTYATNLNNKILLNPSKAKD